MSVRTTIEMVSLDGSKPVAVPEKELAPPAEVDEQVRRTRRRPKKPSGTKIQTQVPREWRQKVLAIAKAEGIRESDVVRNLVARALGVDMGE